MPEPEKKSSGLSLVVLAVPMMLVCCGLPLLVVAGAGVWAAVSSPPFIGGALALASISVGYIVIQRARSGRAAACCLPNDLSDKPSGAAADVSANGRKDGTAARRGEVTRV